MNAVTDSAAAPGGNSQDEVDASLERRIECARICMTLAQDEMSRRDHAERMRLLIALRSPEQIERMERAKGLR